MQDYRNDADEALVERARKGDGAATEELLLRYQNPVRARARKFFFTGAEPDDLVQEGMIGLYKAIGSYSSESGKSFKNYAYLCMTSRIYDYLRVMSRHRPGGERTLVLLEPETIPEGETPEELLIDTEARAEFRMKLLKELSDFEFRVITMYLEGLSYAQICEATGKDVKSIDNALARSKRKLTHAYTR